MQQKKKKKGNFGGCAMMILLEKNMSRQTFPKKGQKHLIGFFGPKKNREQSIGEILFNFFACARTFHIDMIITFK